MKKFKLVILLLISYCISTNAQILNGDFEQGPSSGWTQWSKGGYGLIGTAQFFSSSEITPPVSPLSGLYMARLGGFSYEENYIAQVVTLPNTPQVYFRLYYQTRSSTTSECAGLWVGAQIRIIIQTAAQEKVLYDIYLCHYNDVEEWTFGYLDISEFAGQNVALGIRADAANTVWSYIYLDDISIGSSITVNVEDELTEPRKFRLSQNFPNPFNPSTKISYEIPYSGNVKIVITNLLGEEVALLVNKYHNNGIYEINFDASNLPSGIYIYRLEASPIVGQAGLNVISKKMTLLK